METVMEEEVGQEKKDERIKRDWSAELAKVKELIGEKIPVMAACKMAGISYAAYNYQTVVKGRSLSRKYAPRAITPDMTREEDYNKTLRARILALEKLVVELTLDKQALIESLGGAR